MKNTPRTLLFVHNQKTPQSGTPMICNLKLQPSEILQEPHVKCYYYRTQDLPQTLTVKDIAKMINKR